MAGILFIISAPSGSGKSTLVSQLFTLVEGLEFSISYTTRALRGSEVDGKEYHFTTREEFERKIAADEFLESAEVFGNYYGTALSALEQAKQDGKDLLLDIDVQGALQVLKRLPTAVSIFIMPPTPQVLEMRLRNRSVAEHMTDESVIERRLQEAQKELDRIHEYRYAIVNNVLDIAVSELAAIVRTERGEQLDGEGPLAASCCTDAPSERLLAALGSFEKQVVAR